MASSDPVTVTDVLSFIGGHTDPEALDTIVDAVRDRRRALADAAAVAVTVGATVRLHSLSPRYLNGLTGTVTTIPAARRGAKRRCIVRLDQASVTRLAQADVSYAHLCDKSSYDMGGIPVAACQLVDSKPGLGNREPNWPQWTILRHPGLRPDRCRPAAQR